MSLDAASKKVAEDTAAATNTFLKTTNNMSSDFYSFVIAMRAWMRATQRVGHHLTNRFPHQSLTDQQRHLLRTLVIPEVDKAASKLLTSLAILQNRG